MDGGAAETTSLPSRLRPGSRFLAEIRGEAAEHVYSECTLPRHAEVSTCGIESPRERLGSSQGPVDVGKRLDFQVNGENMLRPGREIEPEWFRCPLVLCDKAARDGELSSKNCDVLIV